MKLQGNILLVECKHIDQYGIKWPYNGDCPKCKDGYQYYTLTLQLKEECEKLLKIKRPTQSGYGTEDLIRHRMRQFREAQTRLRQIITELKEPNP